MFVHRDVGNNSLLAKKFKVLNQPIVSQVQHLLSSDRERLLQRSQLRRQDYKKYTWPKKEEEEDATTEHKKNHDEEIFDDNDFYAQLLHELIDSRISVDGEGDDPILAASAQWAKLRELQRQNRQKRANVDRKASKGRKIR
jgi:protein AATF/BFR2